MIDATILSLKRDYICEALDLAYTHMAWTSRHLQEGRDKQAISAFDKFVVAARSAAEEMKAIRAAVVDPLTAEAAAEYRRSRDEQRAMRPSKKVAA